MNADEARVGLNGGWSGNTRYAVNRITTAGEVNGTSATISARYGMREASVSTNRFDDDSLAEAVATVQAQARLAPENPELMPALGPQTYADSKGWFDSTAGLDPAQRGEVAANGIGTATDAGDLKAAGFLSATAGSSSVANSAGLFAYHASTSVNYSLTVRTDDGTGSGWAGAGERDWTEMDTGALHRRAVDKAVMSRAPRALEPGKYTVVFEPTATADLVGLLAGALDARRADEGRSAFSAEGGGNRTGETIVDGRVSLMSDPKGLGSQPFAGDGLPLEPVTWVENGVLKQLSYDRYWAEQKGVRPTGGPGSLTMSGEARSLGDLIRGTERGVLITRLWYIRGVDPRTILYTGLTRDGTFLIENGEIAYPVNNFRWNDSPLFALSNLEAMSWPERVSPTQKFPGIRVSDFTLSSVSEAV